MLRAGIVGCGRIGSQFDDDPRRKFVATHAGAYTAVDGVELICACHESARAGGKRITLPLPDSDIEIKSR